MQPTTGIICQHGMKKIMITVLGIALLYSCKKDNLSGLKDQFSGEWEYVRFAGYPFNSTPLPPGNGKIIVISRDGSFERRSHDTVTFKGRYSLEEKKDCYGDDKKIFIITTEPYLGERATIELKSDSLFIGTSNCLADGGLSIYRKL